MNLSKLTREQVLQSWENLKSKAMDFKESPNLELNLSEFKKLSQTEKDGLLFGEISNISDGGKEVYDRIIFFMKNGAKTNLERILDEVIDKPGALFLLKKAVEYQLKPSTNQNLWDLIIEREVRGDLSEIIDTLQKFPIPDDSLTLLWSNGLKEVVNWIKNGGLIVPKNWNKNWDEALNDMISYNLDESSELFSQFLNHFSKSFENKKSPLEKYKKNKNSSIFWEEVISENKKPLDMIRVLLIHDIYPDKERSSLYSSSLDFDVSWAFNALYYGQTDLFHFLMQNPLQAELFKEDLKLDSKDSFVLKDNPGNIDFFPAVFDYLIENKFDFNLTNSKGENFFHRWFKEIHARDEELLSNDGLSKKSFQFLIEHSNLILKQKSTSKKAPIDFLKNTVSLAVDKKNVSFAEMKSLLEKNQLKQDMPLAENLSKNKLRL